MQTKDDDRRREFIALAIATLRGDSDLMDLIVDTVYGGTIDEQVDKLIGLVSAAVRFACGAEVSRQSAGGAEDPRAAALASFEDLALPRFLQGLAHRLPPGTW